MAGRTPWAVLTRDGRLLFATRIARLFAYGFLSVVLVLYLVAIGFGAFEVGAILTLTLVGDAAISLWLTTHADRIGRRRVLLAGAGLMVLAGIVFLLSRDLWVMALAATIGVISPSGNEVGPFLAVEQAALSQTVDDRQRTRVFGWYNLAGSFATATGALAAGLVGQGLQAAGQSPLDSYRAIILGRPAPPHRCRHSPARPGSRAHPRHRRRRGRRQPAVRPRRADQDLHRGG